VVTVQTKFQLVNEYKQGHTAAELSEQYGVGVRSVFRWLKRFDGSIDSLRDARTKNGSD
jgi:transposase-like protein